MHLDPQKKFLQHYPIPVAGFNEGWRMDAGMECVQQGQVRPIMTGK